MQVTKFSSLADASCSSFSGYAIVEDLLLPILQPSIPNIRFLVQLSHSTTRSNSGVTHGNIDQVIEVEPHKSSVVLEHLAVALIDQQDVTVLSVYLIGNRFREARMFQNVNDDISVRLLEDQLGEVVGSLIDQLQHLTGPSTLDKVGPDKPGSIGLGGPMSVLIVGGSNTHVLTPCGPSPAYVVLSKSLL